MELMIPIEQIKKVHFHEDDRRIEIVDKDGLKMAQNMLYEGSVWDFIVLADKVEPKAKSLNIEFIYTRG